MEAVPAVIGEFRILPFTQPAFWNEFIRALEVMFTAIHDPVWDAQDGLTVKLLASSCFIRKMVRLTFPGTQSPRIEFPSGGVIRGIAFGPGGK